MEHTLLGGLAYKAIVETAMRKKKRSRNHKLGFSIFGFFNPRLERNGIINGEVTVFLIPFWKSKRNRIRIFFRGAPKLRKRENSTQTEEKYISLCLYRENKKELEMKID